MPTDTADEKRFPPTLLAAAAVLVFGALLLVVGGRLSETGTVRLSYQTPVESRDLRFEDRPDGSVAVMDAESGQPIELMRPATNGFLRMVMRGLARDRELAGIDNGPPFRLTRWEDGRVTIGDTATGRSTELTGFGKANLEAFAKLLETGSDKP